MFIGMPDALSGPDIDTSMGKCVFKVKYSESDHKTCSHVKMKISIFAKIAKS